MQIRIIATGVEGQHTTLFPQTSFPATISAELLAELGAEEVIAAPQAPYVPTYQDKRAAEYPDFRDYLDGIVKGDAGQVQTYIDNCLAVKAKYPKA